MDTQGIFFPESSGYIVLSIVLLQGTCILIRMHLAIAHIFNTLGSQQFTILAPDIDGVISPCVQQG